MANLPGPIFCPMSGRRSIFYNQQPLRSGLSGSIPDPQQGFLDDSTTVAVYQMEGAFITIDQINGNNLTNNGGVTTNASDTQEASYSASFAGSQYFTIGDASQSTNYPLKNGQTNTQWTVTAWVKLTNASNVQVIWGKGDSVNRSIQFSVLSGGNLGFRVHTGVSFNNIDLGVSLSDNVWYHFGFQFNDDTLEYLFVLYNNDTASETIVNASGTIHAPQNIGPWAIGAFGDGSDPITGLIDEFSINGRLLGIPEIREIRQGIYDGPLSNRLTSFGVQTITVSSQKPVRLSQFGVQVLIQDASGPARVSQFGVQVLHLPVPVAVKQYPVLPSGRVYESQTGKRVFPL